MPQTSESVASRQPFVSRKDWTLSTVLALLNHCPQAMMGGTIHAYQKESIPAFLAHLQEVDPDMWDLLIQEKPELDKPLDYVGRKALLRTLNHPIEWTTKHDRYPVKWVWDGEWLSSSDVNAYDKTWGQIALDEVEIKGKPEESAVLIVQDNAWVNEGTQFVD